jgi:hypothetical protein
MRLTFLTFPVKPGRSIARRRAQAASRRPKELHRNTLGRDAGARHEHECDGVTGSNLSEPSHCRAIRTVARRLTGRGALP